MPLKSALGNQYACWCACCLWRRYDGEWQEGLQHGQGKCMYGNGDAYSGSWEGGVRCGKGTCLYADGDKYSGAGQPAHF